MNERLRASLEGQWAQLYPQVLGIDPQDCGPCPCCNAGTLEPSPAAYALHGLVICSNCGPQNPVTLNAAVMGASIAEADAELERRLAPAAPTPAPRPNPAPRMPTSNAGGFTFSSRHDPCLICSRDTDGDCRTRDDLSMVLCHRGSSFHPPDLQRGQTTVGHDGQTWAYTGDTDDGRAAIFVLHEDRPQDPQSAPRRTVRRKQAKAPKPAPLPVNQPELAILPEPFALQSPYAYSSRQRVIRVDMGNGRKRFEAWHKHPETDDWTKGAGPNPWPILNEDAILTACPAGFIIEIEGEKCAGIITATGVAAFCQPGHAHGLDETRDRYRRLVRAGARGVLLVSDSNDADTTPQGKPKVPEGLRRARISIEAAALEGLPLIHLPAADVWPELAGVRGASIDDVQGDPTAAVLQLQTAMQEAWSTLITAPPPPAQEPEPERPAATPTDHSGMFALLGYDGATFFYQPKASGQVADLSAASHTGNGLCRLAPIRYWERAFPGENSGVNWTAAASDLFERQYQVGMFDPSCLRGRGAWTDGPHSIIHLGDRLLVDGVERPTDQRPPGSAYHYQSASRMKGPDLANLLTAQEGTELMEIAERFSWEQDFHGRLLMGWCAAATICGALAWRPHVWLTAAAGSGKTTVLNGFVMPLLGDMGRAYLGNSTEPGIRQDLKHDAIPVVVDEAEGNTFADQQRISAILTLARNASSDSSGVTVKGGNDGPARYRVRSMFLLSSIATGLKQFADQRRFTLLSLTPPDDEDPDTRKRKWQELEALLEARVNQQVGHRLIARMAGDIPRIKAAIRAFVPAATEFFGSQLKGDQLGTLLASAWCVSHDGIPTADDIAAELSLCCWKEQDEDQASMTDERDCLATILEQQVMAEGAAASHRRTIRELVFIAADRSGTTIDSVTPSEAASVLGRHGLKVDESGGLYVSNNAKAIEKFLRDTPWRTSWPAQLRRITGAERHKPVRFHGSGAHRCTRIPLRVLDA